MNQYAVDVLVTVAVAKLIFFVVLLVMMLWVLHLLLPLLFSFVEVILNVELITF